MRKLVLAALLLLVLAACPRKPPTSGGEAGAGTGTAPPPPPPAARTLAVSSGHPLEGRVEGTERAGECTTDADCFTGGCSSEVCSAEEGVITTCEVQDWPQGAGAGCGCVAGACRWYRDGGSGGGGGGGGAGGAGGAAQGEACPDRRCAAGLTCVEYYGIAGPSGPRFTSCEVRCGKGGRCPDGQSCITIADGPGEVCRPADDR